jgi:hypothetical protein
MRYALNVTPINGWEALFGAGQADTSLSASGDGVFFVFGVGDVVSLALDATGTAYAIVHALADAAQQALSAGADGILATLGEGSALHVLSADGSGTQRVFFVGDAAAMSIDALDSSIVNIAVLGAGQASMVASGLAGIPSPHIRPSGYEAKNIMIVSDENRLLTVPGEPMMNPLRERRPLIVSRGDRRL